MRNKDLNGLFIAAPRLNQFNILNLLASDPHLTQAELAQRCDLSVAMVNNYMKELRGAGLLDYRCKSAKSVSYHLTAAGHEKTESVRHELLEEMVGLISQAKSEIRNLVMTRARGTLNRVVLYGTGDLAEVAFLAIESAGVDVVGVCDHDPDKAGRIWCGRAILTPAQLVPLQPDAVIIADCERTTEILRELEPLRIQGVRILPLWDADPGLAAEPGHTIPVVVAENPASPGPPRNP